MFVAIALAAIVHRSWKTPRLGLGSDMYTTKPEFGLLPLSLSNDLDLRPLNNTPSSLCIHKVPKVNMGAAFIDDKTPLCVPFILDTLKNHAASGESSRPFFVGINGVQGAGKTTLVRNLEKELNKRGHKTLVCSIDDFYKTHEDLLNLAQEKSDNALYQHRGVPGKWSQHC
jgi:hypothetical protein